MAKKLLLFLIIFYNLINSACAAEEARDPFVSLGDKLEIAQRVEGELRLPYPIVLKGTLYSKNSLVAIINDDIIKEGQKWRDFYVAKVERSKVTLEWRGKKIELFLNPKPKEGEPLEK